jgi:putative iron-dependent peroxidase
MAVQTGIIDAPPAAGRHLTYELRAGANPREALRRLLDAAPASTVIGVGPSLVNVLGAHIEGLRAFPGLAGAGVATPSTQTALWTFVREATASDAFETARALAGALEPDLTPVDEVSTFVYRGGRDLSGYEDGTENPKGEDAVRTAIVAEGPLAGSSFVATQRWVHDLDRFRKMDALSRDNTIGRRIADNMEIPTAPVSAHIKRSAQESFEPEAFILRRSQPWSEGGLHGLYFVAFGATLDPFERILRRMVGLDDGVVDGLFAFTRPVTGSYFWCPPQRDGRVDLGALGL